MTRSSTVFAVAASVLFVAATGVAIVLVGSPGEERVRRLDEQRVRDLQGISHAIDLHWIKFEALPATLDELRQRYPQDGLRLAEATSGRSYEYRATGTGAYELCAQFEATSQSAPGTTGFWNHGPGRHCFSLSVKAPPTR